MKYRFLKKNFIYFLLLLVSFSIIIYFCISENNLEVLLSSLGNLNVYWLSLALFCVIGSWFLESYILYLLAKRVTQKVLSFKNAFSVTMVGLFFNAITPFSVAGQPMQLLAMNQKNISTNASLSILIRKFLIYQICLISYFLTAIIFKFGFFNQKMPGFMNLAILGFISQIFWIAMLILFSINEKLISRLLDIVLIVFYKLRIIKEKEKIRKNINSQIKVYLNNNKELAKNKKETLKFYCLTIIQMTLIFIVPFLIYKAFRGDLNNIFDMIAAGAFVTMTSSYMPLPGASGAMEGSFIIIFGVFFSSQIINQAMLMWRFMTYYLVIIFGAFFSKFNKKEKENFKGKIH